MHRCTDAHMQTATIKLEKTSAGWGFAWGVGQGQIELFRENRKEGHGYLKIDWCRGALGASIVCCAAVLIRANTFLTS